MRKNNLVFNWKLISVCAFVFLVSSAVAAAVGSTPPSGGYTPDLQEIDPDCFQGDPDCFVNLSDQGYNDTGTRAAGDLIATVGDYDNSGNGTKIELNDQTQQLKFSQDRMLINTDSNSLADFVSASIFQQETGGGNSSNEVNTFRDFIRDAVFSPTSNYTNQVVRLVDQANEDTTGGTTAMELINRKTGEGDLAYQYTTLIKNELHQGDVEFLIGQSLRNQILGTDPVDVSQVMRGTSTNVRVDNPNATVAFAQGMHPTVDLRQGTVNGAQVIFLDYDIDSSNPNLNLDGDMAYLQGGGGSDVAAAIPIVEANGHKFRFIWNEGTAESDFNGIINYLGDVSNIENASDKVLINKEYGNTYYADTYQTASEVEIGTWIDNKPIYRIVIPFSGHTPGASLTHNLDIDTYVKVDAIYHLDSTPLEQIVLSAQNTASVSSGSDADQIDQFLVGETGPTSGNLILEYTKN